jgi:TnpA family transposase
MGGWDQRYLGFGAFPDALSPLEIEHFFTASAGEAAAISGRRTSVNRMAFALQLGFLKMTGRTLNSVDIVPPAVLEHLGRQIGAPPPRVASIRAFYRRRRTLFDHQESARQALGRGPLNDHAERGLTAYLRREAAAAYDVSELMTRARAWLVGRHYVLPRERDIRRQVVAARRHQEQRIFTAIEVAVPSSLRQDWAPKLAETREAERTTHLEWLTATPATRGARALEAQLKKVEFLRGLGADRVGVADLPSAGLEFYGQRIMTRKVGALGLIKEPRRTIELASFLRLTLQRLMDASLVLLDHQIAAQWREARERAADGQTGRLKRFRGLIGDLTTLAGDESLDADALRTRLLKLVEPFQPELQISQVAAIRGELAQRHGELDRLLRAAKTAKLQTPPGHKLAEALAVLEKVGGTAAGVLPTDAANPFGPSWRDLLQQPDRKAALNCYRAATVMLLKRAIRNRSVTAPDSLDHQAPENRLIAKATWDRDRGRLIRNLSLPSTAEKYLQRLEVGLAAGLGALAAAVEAGEISIEGDAVRLPRRKPAPKDARIESARRGMTASMGIHELSSVMIEVDRLTRFSWKLLGRPARSERELVTLYGGLLGLGSDLTVAELARMIPSIDADSLGQMVLRLESDGRLRAANEAVLGFMRQHPVAILWGRGLNASADMMSLEATRYLWSARLDPRRRTFAIGTYAHVLDQWGVLYDQPIVLNRRQAGAAIEGALRQGQVDHLEKVAVDTHGHSHFAMALAKVVGFDLTPRLARLKTRKFHLPTGFGGAIPEVLKPLIAPTSVSRRVIGRGWDELLRLGASVKDGWYPATDALERYGAAARGGAVYEAGAGLGKLLLTLYLCDYLGNREFRTEILDLLNQGEAVHSLQRAIHNGAIPAKRGRTTQQLEAISGALTLLANIVMAWNTNRIQRTADRDPRTFSNDILSHIAPIGHGHINLRGVMTFDLGPSRSALLGLPITAVAQA